MKTYNNSDVDYIYIYLLNFNFFTQKELDLVIKGFGDNIDTYNTICQVRYGMDFDQLKNEQDELFNL